jgi:hypothetical protein
MNVRHEPLLDYLRRRCPGSVLYGPYLYDKRHSYQLMWRGAWLRQGLVPLLDRLPWAEIDPHSYARYAQMKDRYKIV